MDNGMTQCYKLTLHVLTLTHVMFMPTKKGAIKAEAPSQTS